jgi:AraC family ethanolamine operon transcriptional activator
VRRRPVSAPEELVRGVEDYVRRHPGRPLLTRHLCSALDVSESVLRLAFNAVVGMSPMRHLRRVRMQQAHQALQAGQGRRGTVKAAALDHGFWHFSQFAQDYRAIYGRAPSETRD